MTQSYPMRVQVVDAVFYLWCQLFSVINDGLVEGVDLALFHCYFHSEVQEITAHSEQREVVRGYGLAFSSTCSTVKVVGSR